MTLTAPSSSPSHKHRDGLALLFALDWWNEHAPKVYQGLLNGDGWTWDQRQQTYVSDTGTTLGHDDLRHLALTMTLAAELELEQDATRLTQGKITSERWEDLAEDTISNEQYSLAMLGVGGFNNFTPEDGAAVVATDSTTPGIGLTDAMNRLANFRSEIDSGAAGSNKQVVSRSGSYAPSGYSTWANVQRMSWQRMGEALGLRILEVNRLDDLAQHCPQCPALSDRGWVPIGTFPAPGFRQCFSRCRCWLEFKVADEDAE